MLEPDLSCIDDLHTIAQMDGCANFLAPRRRFKWSKKDIKAALREIYGDSTYRLERLVTCINNETRRAYTERTGQRAETAQEYAARNWQEQYTHSQEWANKAYWEFVMNRGRY